MDKIRELALAFCAVSVFSAAAGLFRGKSLIKSGKYIIGIVFICAVISCFKDTEISFDLPETVEPASSEELALSEQGAEYLLAEALRKNSVNFGEISAKATKNETDDIIITEITVFGTDDEEGVMAVLEALEIDCRVIFG